MKEQLISRTQACEILGVKERTIYNYLQKGYLKKVSKKKRIYLVKQDVENFKKSLEAPLPAPDRLMITKLYAEVRQQQKDIELIQKVLNLHHEPLNLPDFSMLALYNALETLDINNWDSGWEEEWGEIILRLREEDFFQLETLTKNPQPWKPFYKFMQTAQDIFSKQKNHELIKIYAAAREHLKTLVLIWLEVKNTPKVLDELPPEEFGKWIIAKLKTKYKKPRTVKNK